MQATPYRASSAYYVKSDLFIDFRDGGQQLLSRLRPGQEGPLRDFIAKQFVERGLDKSSIKLIGTGDVTDDDQLNDMGDGALGVVTSHHYSTAHPSAANKKFVAEFQKANKNLRPNFMAVGGYDGMRVIYEALKKTGGKGGGEALLAGMKGQIFESPRGPIFIDAQTRDIVQDIYIRRVERRDGELHNVEFDTFKAVKDPGSKS